MSTAQIIQLQTMESSSDAQMLGSTDCCWYTTNYLGPGPSILTTCHSCTNTGG